MGILLSLENAMTSWCRSSHVGFKSCWLYPLLAVNAASITVYYAAGANTLGAGMNE